MRTNYFSLKLVILLTTLTFSAPFWAQAQVDEQGGCYSNGVCDANEAELKCPDCSRAPEEPEMDGVYQMPSRKDDSVILPKVSLSPSIAPVDAPEGAGFTPFIFIGAFFLVGIIVAFFMFRSRNTSI